MSETGNTFMARIPFRGERLFEFAKRRGLPTWEVDLGYVAHCALRELFGDAAPQPFALDKPTGPIQPVLGYGPGDAQRLRAAAQLQADPWLWEHLVDWDNLAAKPMPTAWHGGQRLDFTVRAMPVARALRDHAHHTKGAEVDTFLLACRAAGDGVPVDREAVYCQWLHAQVARVGGATLDAVKVARFQLDRPARRNHAQNTRRPLEGRPDVTFTGTLTVTDPAAFRALLARGIGRHRAFGFGMLLVRPPSR